MGSCSTNKGELAKAYGLASPMGSKVVEASNPLIKPSNKISMTYEPHRYPRVPFNYKKTKNEKENLWYKKPCTFCGLNNHYTTRFWKILILDKQI